jgi:coenzyme F420-reducing hydrogenase beta subunit
MIQIKEKQDCCGCTACAQICPKHCIDLKVDDEGFCYPNVNQEECISCGLCDHACPILNKKEKTSNKEINPTAFAAYALDADIRHNSSSGGIFTLLAEEILQRGGVVFGAAFDDKFNVRHISVETKEDLKKLRGSKYTQSNIEGAYKQVCDYLKEKRKILFVGTPCQVAGLKSFIKQDDENLFTVEILCHGVPSPKVWEMYLEQQQEIHGSYVTEINFRSKNHGWKGYDILIEFANGKIYECNHNKDSFMQVFLSDICLRPSCYNCRFKDLGRLSDITLGDCWGIFEKIPEMNDDKGTSLILIHTNAGYKLFSSIQSFINYKETDCDFILPPDSASRVSVQAHHKRKLFLKKMNQGNSFDTLVKISKKKISLPEKCIRKLKILH